MLEFVKISSPAIKNVESMDLSRIIAIKDIEGGEL
jgi:hypothetical protein